MRYLHHSILALGISLLTALQAFPQQRMAFAEGAIELGENEAASVATYCLDLTRDSPKPSSNYSNVLTTRGSAQVVVDGRNIPLQDAIAAGKIEIKGQHISFEEFLSLINDPDFQQHIHMSPEDKHQSALLGAVWAISTPPERQELEKEFEPLLANLGDHTHLQFVSHYPGKVKLVFVKKTVVGTKEESIADRDIDHIAPATTADEQHKIQAIVWAANTLREQEALAYLHYYTGAVDGVSGPKTQAAIKSFQAARGRPATGRLEADDTRALFDQLNRQRLNDVNSVGSEARFVTISFTPHEHNGIYSLLLPGNDSALVTSDPQKLLGAINGQLTAVSSKNIYVDLTGFPQDKAAALMLSLRNGQRPIDDGVVITGLDRGDGSIEVQNLLFQKGVQKVENSDSVTEQITSGENAGFFKTTVRLVIRVGQHLQAVTLEFTTKTYEMARQLVGSIVSLSGASSPSNQTLAGLLADAYRQAHQLNPEITPENFKARIRVQAASVQLAALDIALVSAA